MGTSSRYQDDSTSIQVSSLKTSSKNTHANTNLKKYIHYTAPRPNWKCQPTTAHRTYKSFLIYPPSSLWIPHWSHSISGQSHILSLHSEFSRSARYLLGNSVEHFKIYKKGRTKTDYTATPSWLLNKNMTWQNNTITKGCLTPEHINDVTLLTGCLYIAKLDSQKLFRKWIRNIKMNGCFIYVCKYSFCRARNFEYTYKYESFFFFAAAVHATPTHMQVYAGWLYHWN